MNNMYDILDKMKLLESKGSKPDFLDIDRDGNKTEPMKQAARQAKEKKVEEGQIEEKISPPIKTDPSERGKYQGKGIADLKAMKAANLKKTADYKERGEAVPDELKGKTAELNFAIRAKQAGGGKWGKIREADMEEGNEFTDARLAAIKAGKPTFRVGGKVYRVTGDTSDERKQVDEIDISLIKAAQKHAKKHPLSKDPESERNIGKKYGYRSDRDDKDSDDDYDEFGSYIGKKKKAKHVEPGSKRGPGRPKGSKRSIGAKVKGTSKLHSKPPIKEMGMEDEISGDADISLIDKGEYDREGDMARTQMHTAIDAAKELHDILDSDENLPEWVQQKIAKAVDMLDTVRDYMKSTKAEHGDIDEVAPPGAKAERMVKHIKKAYAKNGKLTPKEKSIAYATAWKAHKAGKVEEEGKEDMEKDKKEVEETTVSGSVATAPEAPKSKGKKGMIFGKGVYEAKMEESFKSNLEKMLTEGISINASQGEDGTKSLTVNATDDDAMKLAQLLQLAGMPQGQDYHNVCPACGQSPCGCEQVDENLANAPDPVYANTEMIKDQGEDLNKPKSTGQTTVPILNKDAARQGVAHTATKIREETEGRLWHLYKKYEKS